MCNNHQFSGCVFFSPQPAFLTEFIQILGCCCCYCCYYSHLSPPALALVIRAYIVQPVQLFCSSFSFCPILSLFCVCDMTKEEVCTINQLNQVHASQPASQLGRQSIIVDSIKLPKPLRVKRNQQQPASQISHLHSVAQLVTHAAAQQSVEMSLSQDSGFVRVVRRVKTTTNVLYD